MFYYYMQPKVMITNIDSLYIANYIHTVFDLMKNGFTIIHALYIVLCAYNLNFYKQFCVQLQTEFCL